jgi:endonuclease/exonuclease/phosphatase family metal-dependent hydrolase
MRKITKIITIILALLFLWVIYSLFSHRIRKPKEYDHSLKVMTYNTQGMVVNKSIKTKMAMLRYINAQDADIVCLQEVLVYKNENRLTLPKLREAMSQYPYTYYDFKLYNSRRQFGNVVFSRYPLINKQTIRFESKTNISSQCDVVVGKDTIRLIVNHLESFKLTRDDLNLDSLTTNLKQENWFDQKLRSASRLRRIQVSTLRKAIRKSPYPVIAVGDFNSLPISWVYWRMNLGMHDCWAESSLGRYGHTYRYDWWLRARIDYIFTSRKLKPISCETGSATYSDHYPVIGTVGWD